MIVLNSKETAMIKKKIENQIKNHSILLYMKGTPKNPQCGFSNKVVNILFKCGKDFSFINILENSDIRSVLPKVADWPTFPQLYIQGKFIGGCDIICDMYEARQLQPMIKNIAWNFKWEFILIKG